MQRPASPHLPRSLSRALDSGLRSAHRGVRAGLLLDACVPFDNVIVPLFVFGSSLSFLGNSLGWDSHSLPSTNFRPQICDTENVLRGVSRHKTHFTKAGSTEIQGVKIKNKKKSTDARRFQSQVYLVLQLARVVNMKVIDSDIISHTFV